MNTIIIAGQKGGAGKSTLAVHLAVCAMHAGFRTVLADLDEQGSATEWSKARRDTFGSERSPRTFPVDSSQATEFLAAAESDRVDTVIVDTPGRLSLGSAIILKTASLVVVPIRPGFFDIATMLRTKAMIDACGRPSLWVLTQVPARKNVPEARDAFEILSRNGIKVSNQWIRHRSAYDRAVGRGYAVSEVVTASGKPPRAAAASIAEIDALWSEIADLLPTKARAIDE